MDNLYTAAENPPGHVYESAMLPYEVQDLRPGFAHNNSGSGTGSNNSTTTKSTTTHRTHSTYSTGTGAVPRKNF